MELTAVCALHSCRRVCNAMNGIMTVICFCLQVHMSEIVPWCPERSQRPGRPARGGGREPDLSCHQGDRGPRQGLQRGPQTSRSSGARIALEWMKISSGIALNVKRLSTRIRSPSMQMRPSLACDFSVELEIQPMSRPTFIQMMS